MYYYKGFYYLFKRKLLMPYLFYLSINYYITNFNFRKYLKLCGSLYCFYNILLLIFFSLLQMFVIYLSLLQESNIYSYFFISINAPYLFKHSHLLKPKNLYIINPIIFINYKIPVYSKNLQKPFKHLFSNLLLTSIGLNFPSPFSEVYNSFVNYIRLQNRLYDVPKHLKIKYNKKIPPPNIPNK
jgi:hypothetical protein